MKRIGILGGTFDPIHFGHIKPALQIKHSLKLDKIWLMPNHIPPHKTHSVTATEHRINMVKLICEEYEEFELCDIEIQRNTPSYTVTTLEELKQKHPSFQYTFLMGMDSLLSLNKWYQWQKLFTLCDIAVSHRPGYQVPANCEMADLYKDRIATQTDSKRASSGRIFDIEIEPQNVSSTQIRGNLLSAINRKSLPDSIAYYINKYRLYPLQ